MLKVGDKVRIQQACDTKSVHTVREVVTFYDGDTRYYLRFKSGNIGLWPFREEQLHRVDAVLDPPKSGRLMV